VKPIVSERDSRLQECRADALVMPLVVDRHEIARLSMPDDDAHPFDLELDRRILHFHVIELNDRLNIRVVRDVAHDGIGVRLEGFLKCVHRVENQVRHGNERRL
jgi:hypothetical protein